MSARHVVQSCRWTGTAAWESSSEYFTYLKEPPMSEPHPRAEPSSASNAHSPPLEPPELNDLLYGLRVRPQTGFEHSKKNINCARLVFAMGMPPAARTIATTYHKGPSVSSSWRMGDVGKLHMVPRDECGSGEDSSFRKNPTHMRVFRGGLVGVR